MARGTYITVDPPYRVVFSSGGSDALPPGGSTIEVELTPDGEDTMVMFTHRGLPSTHIGDHRAGWDTNPVASPPPPVTHIHGGSTDGQRCCPPSREEARGCQLVMTMPL